MSEAWRDWSLEHDCLTWRAALPEDAPAIAEMFETLNTQYGPQDMPDLFAAPVLLTLVAVNDSGVIVDCFYVEAIADITKITTNRVGFAALSKLVPAVAGLLAERHIRLAQMTVPERWSPVMAEPLERAGFASTAKKYVHWVRRVLL